MRWRRVVVVAGVAAALVGLGAAWWSGVLLRYGLQPSPTLWRARSAARSLPKVAALGPAGLTARVPASLSCRDGFGTACSDDVHRITWSVCRVAGPGAMWARTPRTDTCNPSDQEEGVSELWTQDPVARVSIAGYDGYIVSWWPGPHGMRDRGCSFRGYRNDPGVGWRVLHIEGAPACDETLLAMMLSTEESAAGTR